MTVLAAATQSTAQQVYPGLVGFLVVAGMGVAVYFLFRSLNKQLKKITPPGAGTPGRPGQAPGRAPRPGLQAHRAAAAARRDGSDAAGDHGSGEAAVGGAEGPAGP